VGKVTVSWWTDTIGFIDHDRGACADSQEEVLLIAAAVSSSFDDFDGVVDAHDHAGVQRVAA
jgi:hypothetical protein